MTDSMKFGPEWLRNMSNDSGGGGGNGGGGGGGGSGGSSTNHSTSSSNSYNSNSMSSSGGGGGSSHPSQSQFQNLSSSHNLNATPGGPPPGVGGGGGVHHGGAPGGYMANNITFSNPLGGGGGGLGLASAGPRYQLADYRYGREEMLSLFDKNVPLPEILPRFKKLFVDKIQYPLALTPSTEDEVATESQRAIWPIRSASTSIGIATGRGGVRGGSLERGRGRGRGSYHSTALGFQRSTSMYDEDIRGGVGGGGGAPIRAGTWSERNGLGPDAGGGGSGGGIDWNGSGTSPSKGYTRSNTQESWRKGGRLDEESSSGGSNTSSSLALDGWRGGGGGSLTGGSSGFVKWSRSQSWRDEDGDNPAGNPSSSASRYMNMMSMGGDRGASERGLGLNSPAAKAAAMHARKLTPWEDDNLPEWAIEDPIEGGGSFDASGAFHGTEDGTAPGKASAKDDGGSGGSGSETDAKSDRKHSSTETSDADAPTTADSDPTVASSTPTPPNSSSSSASTTSSSSTSPSLSTPTDHPSRTPADPSTARPPTLPGKSASPSPTMSIPASEAQAPKADAAPVVAASPAKSAAAATVVAATSAAKPTQSPVTNHADSVDRMKAQADDMVKKLVMDDEFAASPSPHSQRAKSQDMYQMSLHNQLQLQPNPAAALSAVGTGPPEQRNNNLWFYRDPQGTVQGAFPAAEMSEWYRAGYFDENLLVRRQGDTTYAALGDLVRICNGIPFIYTHFIPPLESLDIAVLLEGIAAGHPPAFMLHVAALGIGSVTPQQSPAPGPLTVPTVPPGGPTVGPSPTQADLLQMNFHLHMLQKQFFIRQHGMVLQKLAASESWHLMTAEQQSNLISQHMAQIPIPEHLLPGAAAAGIGVPAGPVGLVVGPGGGPSPSGGIAAQVGGPKPVQQQQQQQKNTSNRPGGGPPHPLYASHHLHDPAVLAAANNDTSAMQHLLHQLNHQPQLPLPIPMPPSASTSSSSLSSVTQSSGSTNPIKSLMLQLSMQKGGAGAANAGGGPANAADKQPIVGWMGTTGVAGGQPPKLDQTNVWDMALIGGGGGKSMHPEMKTESQILEEQMSQQHQHQQHMQLQMQQHQQQQQHLQQLQYQQLMAAHEREHAQVQQLQHMRHFEGNNNNSSNAFDSQQQRHFPNAAAAAAAAAAGRHPIMAHNNTSGAKDGPEINEENDIMSDLWMQQQQHHHSQQQQQLHIQQQQQQNLQQQQQQPPQQPQPGDMSAAAKQRADKKAANDDKKKLLGEDTEKWSSVGNGRKKDQSPRVGPNDSPAAKKSGGGVVQQQIGASTPQDDKKRAKELKRLQIEEERRRAQEEEKRRQIAEEKKRLEDISEQRRLKLMDVARTSSSGTTQSLAAALGVTQKPNSAGSAPSIAPWLGASQPTQTAQPQVSLADIQKAERERRAEQFRVDQLMREQQHNQMQMAAAEQKENALKWNLKPHSVKSLAEIQAEEAKRQAVLERERQHNIMMANAAAAIGPSSVLVGKKSSDSLVGGAGGVGVGGGSLSLGLASAMGAAAGASQGSGFSSGFSSIWNNSTANTSLWNTSKPMWGTNGPGVAAQMSQPPPQLHQQQQQQHGHTVAAALAAAHSQHHQQQQHQHQQSQSMSHLGGGFWEEPPSAPTGFAGVTAAQSLSSAAATKSVTIRSTVGLSATTATPPKTLVKSQTVSNMQQAAAKSSAKQQQQNQAKPLTKASSSANVSAGGGSVSAKPNKKKAAGDESGSSHEFTAWCCKALSAHADIVDVPTFVAFLRDIESPFEVKDYIRMYLGETKDCLEFARQYLERRSKYKNQLRAANAHIDDMCQPAPAITPSHGNDFQEVKGKAKKEKKKNKMVKLDTRILGFSVTAAQDRLNVGDRDYGDAP